MFKGKRSDILARYANISTYRLTKYTMLMTPSLRRQMNMTSSLNVKSVSYVNTAGERSEKNSQKFNDGLTSCGYRTKVRVASLKV